MTRAIGVLIGLALLAGGGRFGWDAWQEQWNSVVVTGRVTKLIASVERARGSKGGNREHVYSIIEYGDGSGRKYQVESHANGRKNAYPQGAEVRVRYREGHPEQASVDSFGSIWLAPVAMTVLGALFLGVAITQTTASDGAAASARDARQRKGKRRR